MHLLLILDAETTSRGLSIALTGMVIVFAVLILISLFIAALPRVLEVVATVFPEVEHGHDTHSHADKIEDDDVIAGIGFVLHTEIQKLELQQLSIQPANAARSTGH